MHSMHLLSIWSFDVREFEYELFTDDFFIRKVLEGFIRMFYTLQLPRINMLHTQSSTTRRKSRYSAILGMFATHTKYFTKI